MGQRTLVKGIDVNEFTHFLRTLDCQKRNSRKDAWMKKIRQVKADSE